MVERESSSLSVSPRDGTSLPSAGWGPPGGPPALGLRRRAGGKDADILLTPQFVLRAFAHWWWAIIPASLLLVAASLAAIWYFFQPVYRASAWIQIEPRTPRLVAQDREETDKPEQEQFVNTQVELMRGPLVLSKLVAKPEIANLPELRGATNAVQTLKQQIEVVPVGKSQLYEVAYEGHDPGHAALLVNAVVEGYFELLDDLKIERQQRVVDLLDQEQSRRAQEVERLRQRMHELGKDILGRDPFTGVPTADAVSKHPLAVVHDRLIAAEVEAKVLEVQVQALEESLKAEKVSAPSALVELGIDQSQELRDLEMLLAAKRATLERVETTAKRGKDDQAYDRLSKEIVDYEKGRRKLRDALRPRVTEEVKARAEMERKDELARLQNQLTVQRVLQQMLQTRYEQQLKEAGTSGQRSLELEFTRSELAREERVFELIADRAMFLRTELRAPGRVSPLQRAEAPDTPLYRFPPTVLALALLISLSLPAGIALLWELQVRRITHAKQLEGLTNIALLGEVARLPVRPLPDRAKSTRRASRARDLFEESIDSLRTCLVLPDEHRSVHVLAVTSAVPDEGKTSLATQLALSIARATRQLTLLIDADLRSPDLHHVFHIPNEPGLAQLLERGCQFDEAVHTQWSEWVHVLPAGQLRKSPHELLGDGRFAEILNEARGRYPHIVIDTPPILAASESLVVSKLSDGTLLCAMRGRSREDQVELAHRRLLAAGAKPLGAVLNAVPTRSYAFTYGNYRYQHAPS